MRKKQCICDFHHRSYSGKGVFRIENSRNKQNIPCKCSIQVWLGRPFISMSSFINYCHKSNQNFLSQVKLEPNKVTRQDQNTVILLDFNGSFDEFNISLSLSLRLHFHQLNNPHHLNEMIHQKHCFPRKYSPPDFR